MKGQSFSWFSLLFLSFFSPCLRFSLQACLIIDKLSVLNCFWLFASPAKSVPRQWEEETFERGENVLLNRQVAKCHEAKDTHFPTIRVSHNQAYILSHIFHLSSPPLVHCCADRPHIHTNEVQLLCVIITNADVLCHANCYTTCIQLALHIFCTQNLHQLNSTPTRAFVSGPPLHYYECYCEQKGSTLKFKLSSLALALLGLRDRRRKSVVDSILLSCNVWL